MKKSLLALSLTSLSFYAMANTNSYEIIAKDGRFTPETIEIPANQKVKLIVKNEGTDAEEFESHDLNREKIIAPGRQVEVSIGPLKPGTYKFFGEFHPKTANGQIVVK